MSPHGILNTTSHTTPDSAASIVEPIVVASRLSESSALNLSCNHELPVHGTPFDPTFPLDVIG